MGLQVALAPCLLGYGAIAKQLHGDQKTKTEGNPYWAWIQNYAADDYVQAVRMGSGSYCLLLLERRLVLQLNWITDLLERQAVLQSPARIEELVEIFIHATKVRGAEPDIATFDDLTGLH